MSVPTANWLVAYLCQNYWFLRLRELQRCVTIFNGMYSLPDSSLVLILSVGITIARVFGPDAPLVMRIAYYTTMGLACLLFFETWQVTFTELVATIAWAVVGTLVGLFVLRVAYEKFEVYWAKFIVYWAATTPAIQPNKKRKEWPNMKPAEAV